MRLPVRTRLTISFTILFGVLIVFFSAVVYTIMSRELEKEFKQQIEHDAQQVLHVFKEHSWDDAIKELNEESEEFKLRLQLYDQTGYLLFRSQGLYSWDLPVHHDVLLKAKDHSLWSNGRIEGRSHLILTQWFQPTGQAPHIIQMAKSRKEINTIKEKLIFCFNIGTPLILLLGMGAGHLFSKRALSPVEWIRQRAGEIGSENLSARLPVDGPDDELSRLAITLNDLLGRIEEAFEKMKRFTADASHELRIPLTGLRGILEVALWKERSKEEYKDAIENAYQESERLSELVWDLLTLAKADSQRLTLEKKEMDLRLFLAEVFEEAQLLDAEKKLTWEFNSIPDIHLKFDEDKIRHLLMNLFDNAVKYNTLKGRVSLSATLEGNTLHIFVKDTGMGLSPMDQKKIFDRFYRVDKGRSRQEGGMGLGLSIARSIAEAHQGHLTVQSVLGQGSAFRLSLPLH